MNLPQCYDYVIKNIVAKLTALVSNIGWKLIQVPRAIQKLQF